MSPRAYDRRFRQAAAEEAKRRIVEAAAALHARHGGTGTSHAMIAREAGVSIPTVYKYFPTPNDLVPACTGLVAGRAPVRVDETLLNDLDSVPARVRAIAGALFRLHEYFAPWLRWSDADADAFPSLREFLQQAREHQVAIIRRALWPEGSKKPPEMLIRLAQILLGFPSWRTLTEAGHSSDQAAAQAAEALLAIHRCHHFSKE